MHRPFSVCTQPSRAIVCWPQAGTAHKNRRSEQKNAETCNVAGRRKHRHFMESFPGSTGHNKAVPAWSQGRSLLYHPASARTTMGQHYNTTPSGKLSPLVGQIGTSQETHGCRKRGRMRVSAACYSVRSAFMGEIEAARLAGMMAAKKAQTASAPAATPRASGSQLETP